MSSLVTYFPPESAVELSDPNNQVGVSEPLASGVKRVTMHQLEYAASGFFDGEDNFQSAVHESRKALKRVRALLRLFRGEVGRKVFTFEDRHLRETGRLLTEIRVAAAVTEAAEVIERLYGQLLAEDTFAEMIARLSHRRDRLATQALEDPALVGRVVRNLEKAHHRYASWPTDPDARNIYGVGIRNDYQAFAPGLRETYLRGRQEMVVAYSQPSVVNFHRWRKSAKYLTYQMEFMTPMWPEVISGTAATLDRLGLLLGEEHDLADLLSLLQGRPDLCPSPRERSLLAALTAQRRSELQTAAEVLGRRVFAERPTALSRRFGEYWDSRVLALTAGRDMVVVN